MTNPWAGGFADVLKHLVLCDVVDGLAPREVWESHAGGPGLEAVPDDRLRAHGARYFASVAAAAPGLDSSRFVGTLAQVAPAYPGSALLSAAAPIDRLVLCELDEGSAKSLERSGLTSLRAPQVELIQADGCVVLAERAGELASTRAEGVLAFIDPFALLYAEPGGARNSLELAVQLREAGVKVLLFYGFNSRGRRKLYRRAVAEKLVPEFFVEVVRAEPPADDLEGAWGCALVGGGWPDELAHALAERVAAFVGLYEGAPQGALRLG